MTKKHFCFLLLAVVLLIKVECEERFQCINAISVGNDAVYISSAEFPMTINWKNRQNCQFTLKKETEQIAFIITNGHLTDVLITYDNETK